MKRLTVILLALFVAACAFPAHSQQLYHVYYGGGQCFFTGGESEYAEGAQVHFVYDLIATDTDYSFYVDGVPFSVGYNGGFVFDFVMPDHDVTVWIDSENSMVSGPRETFSRVLDLFQKTAGTAEDQGYTELVLEKGSNSTVRLKVCSEDGKGHADYGRHIVPAEILTACVEIIERYGMASWSSVPAGTPLTGSYCALRYSGDPGPFRADTRRMPDGGADAFDELSALLTSCITE